MDWPGVGWFEFDAQAGDAVVHPAPHADTAEIDDTFIRGVLPVVFIARGHEALHASAVLLNGRLIAFAAESGTGKSTLAAAVARVRGGTHWADDTTLWTARDGLTTSTALPFPSRLDAAAYSAVRGIGDAAASAEPGSVAHLGVMYLVRRSHLGSADVEFGRVPPVVAFRRGLAHAHPFDLADRHPRQLVERVLALASRLPVFELRLRSGLLHLPAVADLVARHAASVQTT